MSKFWITNPLIIAKNLTTKERLLYEDKMDIKKRQFKKDLEAWFIDNLWRKINSNNSNISPQRQSIFDKLSPKVKNRINFDKDGNAIFILESGKKIKFWSKLATENSLWIKADNPEITNKNNNAKEFINKRKDNNINEVDYFKWENIDINKNITRENIEEIINMMPTKDYKYQSYGQSTKELLVLLWLIELNSDDSVDPKCLTSYRDSDSGWQSDDLGGYGFIWLPIFDGRELLYFNIKSYGAGLDWGYRGNSLPSCSVSQTA